MIFHELSTVCDNNGKINETNVSSIVFFLKTDGWAVVFLGSTVQQWELLVEIATFSYEFARI